jgi:signal peptidase I
VNETPAPAPPEPSHPPAKKEEGSFLWFLVKLVIAVLIFRTFIFSTFSIPSESMLPRLMVGDYLFTEKWPYGISRASIPFDLDLFEGRIFGHDPARGDIVVFKHPLDRTDYIKRVIGLPGDTVQMKGGVLYLNGEAVKKQRVADFVAPIGPHNLCRITRFRAVDAKGTPVCRYPRFRETLPGGRSYDVLDSRFPAAAGEGVGLVPEENLVGRAVVIAFSTDGTLHWFNPVSWFRAARWDRIGAGL